MCFEDSLDGFLRHMKMSRTGSADTQNAYHRDVLRFLQFLEEEGIESFEDVTKDIVLTTLPLSFTSLKKTTSPFSTLFLSVKYAPWSLK